MAKRGESAETEKQELERQRLLKRLSRLTPGSVKRYLDRSIVGQEQVKRCVAATVATHYRRVARNGLRPIRGGTRSNIFLIGPTGSGKTLIAEQIANFVGVPVYIDDATGFTEEGYVGKDVSDLITGLCLQSSDRLLTGCGILYLDEVDKIADVGTGRNVSRIPVQNALLKMIEGKRVQLGAVRNGSRYFDTSNLLWIVSGAFEGLENLLEGPSRVGFRREPVPQRTALIDGLQRYGMQRQFLGRFKQYAVTEELTVDQLCEIFSLDDSPAVSSVKEDFGEYGIDLEFSPEGVRAIASEAYLLGIGARGIDTVISRTLSPFLYALPSTRIRSLVVEPPLVEDPEGHLERLLSHKKGARQLQVLG